MTIVFVKLTNVSLLLEVNMFLILPRLKKMTTPDWSSAEGVVRHPVVPLQFVVAVVFSVVRGTILPCKKQSTMKRIAELRKAGNTEDIQRLLSRFINTENSSRKSKKKDVNVFFLGSSLNLFEMPF